MRQGIWYQWGIYHRGNADANNFPFKIVIEKQNNAVLFSLITPAKNNQCPLECGSVTDVFLGAI